MNCLFGLRPLGAFRPLQRSSARSARKQPEGCGPRRLRFKGRAHGWEAAEASHEPGRDAFHRVPPRPWNLVWGDGRQ
ncbi:MAG: hypothetical protein FJ398_21945 [Verrucomicrobia bacterium]|nr:hypothetical protein [Verrucomicrobiota bacterium]